MRGTTGQATTETLLTMSFLLLLIFATVQLTWWSTQKYLANLGAFSAMRAGMVGSQPNEQLMAARQVVKQKGDDSAIGGGGIGGQLLGAVTSMLASSVPGPLQGVLGQLQGLLSGGGGGGGPLQPMTRSYRPRDGSPGGGGFGLNLTDALGGAAQDLLQNVLPRVPGMPGVPGLTGIPTSVSDVEGLVDGRAPDVDGMVQGMVPKLPSDPTSAIMSTITGRLETLASGLGQQLVGGLLGNLLGGLGGGGKDRQGLAYTMTAKGAGVPIQEEVKIVGWTHISSQPQIADAGDNAGGFHGGFAGFGSSGGFNLKSFLGGLATGQAQQLLQGLLQQQLPSDARQVLQGAQGGAP